MREMPKETVEDCSHRLAASVCLFGLFLQVILSNPLLNALGFHYSGEGEHRFYERIHPGSLFIYVSFLILLWDRGNPLHALIVLGQRYAAFVILLFTYFFLLAYLVLRSGIEGTAFLFDVHMTVPMAVLVLSCAPQAYCRRALVFFLLIAAINAVTGIAESLGRFRIFTFDPDWQVLHETHFRASALRGHPLLNAMFSTLAMFVALGLRLPSWLKAFLVLLFMASLIAFGGRASLLFSLFGLALVGVAAFLKALKDGNRTLRQWIGIMAASLLLPLCLAAFVVALMHSPLGERLMAAGYWDESANSRLLVMHVFDHLSLEDILFGVSPKRVNDITANINSGYRLGGIENPWILLLIIFGAILFPVWLAATAAFFVRLMRGQDFALKMAIIAYFAIASTYNSFAVKDSSYLIMACLAVCAARIPKTGLHKPQPPART